MAFAVKGQEVFVMAGCHSVPAKGPVPDARI